jgi:hypothetical protein
MHRILNNICTVCEILWGLWRFSWGVVEECNAKVFLYLNPHKHEWMLSTALYRSIYNGRDAFSSLTNQKATKINQKHSILNVYFCKTECSRTHLQQCTIPIFSGGSRTPALRRGDAWGEKGKGPVTLWHGDPNLLIRPCFWQHYPTKSCRML